MKQNLITLFTIGLLLLTASVNAKLPSAYAGTLVRVEQCVLTNHFGCLNKVNVEIINIDKNGLTIINRHYLYDNAGRTKNITNLQDASIISKFEYLLDDNGNRSKQTETQTR